ncbi:hypothetical protein ABTD98_21665, partial [Acinetobacter baumannii]
MKPSSTQIALFTIITMATAPVCVEWTPAPGRRPHFLRVDPTDAADVTSSVDRILALGAGDATLIEING